MILGGKRLLLQFLTTLPKKQQTNPEDQHGFKRRDANRLWNAATRVSKKYKDCHKQLGFSQSHFNEKEIESYISGSFGWIDIYSWVGKGWKLKEQDNFEMTFEIRPHA